MRFVALPQFIIACTLYIIHFILVHTVTIYNTTIIRYYFADVLALIVCVPIFINSQILFGIRKKRYITILDIFAYILLFSIYFEVIAPNFLAKITSDPLDILAYAIGGFILYFSQRFKSTDIKTWKGVSKHGNI